MLLEVQIFWVLQHVTWYILTDVSVHDFPFET